MSRDSIYDGSAREYKELDFIKKVSQQYRKLGITLILFGIFLAISVTISMIVFVILNPTAKSNDMFIYYFLALFLLFISGKLSQWGVVFIQKSKEIYNPGGGTYKIYVVLSCIKCGFTKTRRFKEGDYVGKLTEESCDVCGSAMIITKIYATPERKLESTGMPILPLMQEHSVKTKIRLAILELFTPFKFAFKYKSSAED